MMKTEHTPGDWLAEPSNDYAIPAKVTCNGEHIATAESIGHREEMNANAQLIAATPELLSALKHLVHKCVVNGTPRCDNALKQARAAIDKATKKP